MVANVRATGNGGKVAVGVAEHPVYLNVKFNRLIIAMSQNGWKPRARLLWVSRLTWPFVHTALQLGHATLATLRYRTSSSVTASSALLVGA